MRQRSHYYDRVGHPTGPTNGTLRYSSNEWDFDKICVKLFSCQSLRYEQPSRIITHNIQHHAKLFSW